MSVTSPTAVGYADPHQEAVSPLRRSVSARGTGANLPLPVISLSEQFMKLLHVGDHSAYSLAPVFACRVDVYTTTMLTQEVDSMWRPAALIISQDGVIYLFDAVEDGLMFNSARLGSREAVEWGRARRVGQVTGVGRGRGGSRRGSIQSSSPLVGEGGNDESGFPDGENSMVRRKARVDLIVESAMRPNDSVQCVYIRCRDPIPIPTLVGGSAAAATAAHNPNDSRPPSIMKANATPKRGEKAEKPEKDDKKDKKGKPKKKGDKKDSSDDDDDDGDERSRNASTRRRAKSTVRFSEARDDRSERGPSTSEPGSTPFSYILRFHCRNADVALQFATVVRYFTNEAPGDLSFKRTNAYLEEYIPENALADPFVAVVRRSSSRSRSGSVLRSLFGRSKSGGSSGEITIADVARAEKKRLERHGVKVMIPPRGNPMMSPPRPRWADMSQMPPANTAAQAANSGAAADQQQTSADAASTAAREVSPDAPGAQGNSPGKTEEGSAGDNHSMNGLGGPMLPMILFPPVEHFTFTEREDVLRANGLLGFEQQAAIFIEEPSIGMHLQQAALRLLHDQGLVPSPPFTMQLYDSYVAHAKQIAKEEVRGFYGGIYVELNTHTRKAMASLNIDSLILNDQKERMEAQFKAELSAIRLAHEEQLTRTTEKESSLYFRDSKPYYQGSTNSEPVPPICQDEPSWQREMATSAKALNEIRNKINRLKRALYLDYNDDSRTGSNVNSRHGSPSRKSGGGDDGDGGGGGNTEMSRTQQRISAEAERLMAQVYDEEVSIRTIQKQIAMQRQTRLRDVQFTYSGWVEQQQMEIDSLKDRFMQLSEYFGLHPSLNETQTARRRTTDLFLGGGASATSFSGGPAHDDENPMNTRTPSRPSTARGPQPGIPSPSLRQMMLSDI